MFENRSDRELIAIYIFIALAIALIMAAIHYLQGWHPYLIIGVANVWFFCLFYILNLPIKLKRAREKKEKSKKGLIFLQIFDIEKVYSLFL